MLDCFVSEKVVLLEVLVLCDVIGKFSVSGTAFLEIYVNIFSRVQATL